MKILPRWIIWDSFILPVCITPLVLYSDHRSRDVKCYILLETPSICYIYDTVYFTNREIKNSTTAGYHNVRQRPSTLNLPCLTTSSQHTWLLEKIYHHLSADQSWWKTVVETILSVIQGRQNPCSLAERLRDGMVNSILYKITMTTSNLTGFDNISQHLLSLGFTLQASAALRPARKMMTGMKINSSRVPRLRVESCWRPVSPTPSTWPPCWLGSTVYDTEFEGPMSRSRVANIDVRTPSLVAVLAIDSIKLLISECLAACTAAAQEIVPVQFCQGSRTPDRGFDIIDFSPSALLGLPYLGKSISRACLSIGYNSYFPADIQFSTLITDPLMTDTSLERWRKTEPCCANWCQTK